MATLKPTLGVLGLTFYGVGMIVGAGVYTVIGAAAGLAGNAVWLSFVLGAAVAVLTAFSYAELSTMFPTAGAEYVYVKAAFPRAGALPFLLGLVLTLAGAGTAATVSLAFAGYLAAWVPIPPVVAALALVVALTAINLLGLKAGSKVNIVFTLLEVGGLVAFVALGASQPEFGRGMLEIAPDGVFAGAALLFFAYLGFENLVNLAEDAKDPARDLPRAILVSVAVTTLLYAGVGLAATALLEPDRLASSHAPLSSAAATASTLVAKALGVVALFATANTALIALLSTSRLLFAMGRDGAAPKVLAAVRERHGSPWLASLVLAAVAGALVPLGDVKVVASLASFAALLAFVAVNLCVIVLRYRQPATRRPFRVPIAIGRFPVLPALGLASAGFLLVHFDVWSYVAGGGAVALALVLYGAHAWWKRRSAAKSSAS